MTDTPTREPSVTANEAAEQLAAADHEWSMANDRIRCAAHYVPVRPCTPADHMEWAEAIVAILDAVAGLTGEEPSE